MIQPNIRCSSLVQTLIHIKSNVSLVQVDEKTREQMFKLRQTWSEIFPAKTLHALDSKVHQIDPAWPVSAPPPTILLNPKFFKTDVIVSVLLY